jgi:peptidylprolyl isomerase
MADPARRAYVVRMQILRLVSVLLCTAACVTKPVSPSVAAGIPPMRGPSQIALALRYVDGTVGSGASAANKQCVFVHYTGWLTNGTKFDSSRDTSAAGTPRTPIGFPLGYRRVIAGWDLGFETMKVGGKRRLFIPYPLAYGDAGRPPVIPERADLIFDVELLAVSDTLSRAESLPQRGPTPQCPTWATMQAKLGQ